MIKTFDDGCIIWIKCLPDNSAVVVDPVSGSQNAAVQRGHSIEDVPPHELPAVAAVFWHMRDRARGIVENLRDRSH